MRDILLERVFAGGLFLVLWLYYRWLERGDRKCRERGEQKRREEREGSIPLPPELQWRGAAFEDLLDSETVRRGDGAMR